MKELTKRQKKALLTDISNTKIPCTNLKPTIFDKFMHDKWQKSWDNQIHKLLYIQDTIGEWPVGYRRNRNVLF